MRRWCWIVRGLWWLPVWIGVIVPTTRGAEVVSEAGKVTAVTVFRDRAEITRTVRVDVPAGAVQLELAGLPPALSIDTLRVNARGVPASLRAVELVDRARERRESAEFLAARAAVEQLQSRLQALDGEARVDNRLDGFLGTIGESAATLESERLTEGTIDVERIDAAYELLARRWEQLEERGLQRTSRQRELARELEEAKARLETERQGPSIQTRSAIVQLDVARAGTLTLEAAYVTTGAGWRPAYRASLDAAEGAAKLTAEAVIRQTTGEDWTDVALVVSTAAPAMGVEPPRVDTYWLGPDSVGSRAQAAPVPGRLYQNVLKLAEGANANSIEEMDVVAEDSVAATRVEAIESRSAYSMSFSVPGASRVPSDGREHTVNLYERRLEGERLHRAAPAQDARAFLTLQARAPKDTPLLAGRTRVFVDDAFIGSFRLLETGPGSDVTLAFGPDNRVQVERLAGEETDGGSGRTREMTRVRNARITNRATTPVALQLEDRVPVSVHDAISVEILRDTTDGYVQSERRPGVLLWRLELAAGESRDIRLAYRVRLPRDMAVSGLP